MKHTLRGVAQMVGPLIIYHGPAVAVMLQAYGLAVNDG